jgi:hypothetical protein
VIKKNVEQYKGSTESEVSESASGEPRRLLIKRFTFKKGHVRAVLDSDSDRELEVELPEVKMTNVGGQNGGTPDQIGKEVLAAFGQSATRALAKEGIKSVLEQKIEGKAGDAAKKVLDSILK